MQNPSPCPQIAVEQALAAAPPNVATKDIWLFAQGAMLEDPPFTPVDKATIACLGWRRAFCLADPALVGTPDRPGLTLGLVEGHHCVGVAWRVLAQTAEDDLARTFAVEMRQPHRAVWASIRSRGGHATALVLVADTTSPRFEPHLSDEQIIARIAGSAGQDGANADYLALVVGALDRAGLADLYVSRLWAGVRRASDVRL